MATGTWWVPSTGDIAATASSGSWLNPGGATGSATGTGTANCEYWSATDRRGTAEWIGHFSNVSGIPSGASITAITATASYYVSNTAAIVSATAQLTTGTAHDPFDTISTARSTSRTDYSHSPAGGPWVIADLADLAVMLDFTRANATTAATGWVDRAGVRLDWAFLGEASASADTETAAAGEVVSGRPDFGFIRNVAGGMNGSVGTQLVLTLAAGVNTDQGDTLIMNALGAGGGTISGIADSKGNAWTVDKSVASTTVSAVCSAYLARALVEGDTITITYGSCQNFRANVTQWAGIDPERRPDRDGSATGSAPYQSVTAATSLAGRQAKELAFCAVGHGGSTQGSWTLTPTDPNSGGTWVNTNYAPDSWGAAAYQILDHASTVSCTWTTNGTSDGIQAAVVTYRAAPRPYKFASGTVNAVGNDRTCPVVRATTAGDTLLLVIGVNNTGSVTLSNVTDSQGNVYTLDRSQTATTPSAYFYRSPGATGGSGGGPTAALSTTDTVNYRVSSTGVITPVVGTCVPRAGPLDVVSALATPGGYTYPISETPTFEGDYAVAGLVIAASANTLSYGDPYVSDGFEGIAGSSLLACAGSTVLGVGTSGVQQTATATSDLASSGRTVLWLIRRQLPAQVVGATNGNAGCGAAANVAYIDSTLPAGWQAGDLCVALVYQSYQSGVTDISQSGTGTWTKHAYTGAPGGVPGSAVFSRVMAEGDTAPRFTLVPATTAEMGYSIVCLRPAEGSLAVDAWATDVSTNTADAVYQANAATAAGADEVSVILLVSINNASGVYPPVAEAPPAGWQKVWPAWGGYDGEVGYWGWRSEIMTRDGVSGTVTPGQAPLTGGPSQGLFENVYHVLLKPAAGGPVEGQGSASAAAAAQASGQVTARGTASAPAASSTTAAGVRVAPGSAEAPPVACSTSAAGQVIARGSASASAGTQTAAEGSTGLAAKEGQGSASAGTLTAAAGQIVARAQGSAQAGSATTAAGYRTALGQAPATAGTQTSAAGSLAPKTGDAAATAQAATGAAGVRVASGQAPVTAGTSTSAAGQVIARGSASASAGTSTSAAGVTGKPPAEGSAAAGAAVSVSAAGQVVAKGQASVTSAASTSAAAGRVYGSGAQASAGCATAAAGLVERPAQAAKSAATLTSAAAKVSAVGQAYALTATVTMSAAQLLARAQASAEAQVLTMAEGEVVSAVIFGYAWLGEAPGPTAEPGRLGVVSAEPGERRPTGEAGAR